MLLRRLYSTNPGLPKAALAARTASAPLAVRLRREQKAGKPVAPGETDATIDGLTPSESARYERLKALGTLKKNDDGSFVSPREWSNLINARRSRVRGLRTVKHEGKEEVEVLGQPIYLPNILFKLIRNHTSPAEAYNPYEATFRVPLSITKTDIRSYLLAVYGVKTTYIRTDIYYGALPNPRKRVGPGKKAAYKRAVVGLVDPFYYPHRMEDMAEKEKKERLKFIEENFHLERSKEERKTSRTSGFAQLLGSDMKTWELRGLTSRAAILKRVADRRQEKEMIISEGVQKLRSSRETGEPFVIEAPRVKRRVPSEDAVSNTPTAPSP
ncbi:hypothetical protein D9758_007249 [Tetrapyrgos nigripes]|uniref:Large ribosomal subunit protein uL23m n=1 Tax=Tetrapyrgos nigripes TaxID=182062 RepID=A0A8H5FVP9_9AGAR|nr:hypothetical protein D9758_007249 [Tetrapyrgos nigripes]